MFDLVTFPNLPCNTSGATFPKGTCYRTDECQTLGGKAGGSCAQGMRPNTMLVVGAV